MAVSAPDDRRFRRGRAAVSTPRRRRAARMRVLVRLLGLTVTAVLVVVAAAWVVRESNRLTVVRVVVTGNEQMATGDLQALLQGLQGQPLLTVDLDQWRGRLEQSPWVGHAALRRVLPDLIEVRVTERRPLAIGRVGPRLVLVDASGAVIDEFGPRYEMFDLPIIDGLVQRSGPADAGPPTPPAALVAGLLGELAAEPALLARLSQVEVVDAETLVVWLDDDPARLIVGDREFGKRLHGYLEVRAALRARVSDIEAVDLRFGRRVFVRPGSVAAGGRTSSGAGAPRARS